MKIFISLVLSLFLVTGQLMAQEVIHDPNLDLKVNIQEEEHFINRNNVQYINWGVPLVFAAYGALFWDWGRNAGFTFRDEGWFTKNTYAGGTDKLAHMYSHYLLTRSSYAFYRHSGLTHEEALKHSFILGSAVGLMIEVGDGISHYGFAVNDLISDLAGIGLAHLLNQNSYLDELIGFQLWWWNDDTATGRHNKGEKLRDPIDDYNNQKYVFNFRMAAIPGVKDFIGTRYLNLDLGYMSRGYKTTNANNSETVRHLYTGVSINFSQLLKDLFPNSEFAQGAAAVTRYYQLPYSSIELTKWDDRD